MSDPTAVAGPLEHIAADLRPLAVPLEGLTLDPRNARTHDERNLAAIAASLARYGQRKPIVVHAESGVVIAGNGTLQAARSLGYTHLAAVRVDDDPATQLGYSLADNRTAELAGWDQPTLLALSLELKESDELMFDELVLADLLGQGDDEAAPDESADYEMRYQLMVTCRDETHQVELMQELDKRGVECRALIT